MQANNPNPPFRPAQTFKTFVKEMYENGQIECGEFTHYTPSQSACARAGCTHPGHAVGGRGHVIKRADPKGWRAIFDAMSVGARASCFCERNALRTASYQRPDYDTRTCDVVAPGAQVKGIASAKDAALGNFKRVWSLNYALSDSEFRHLTEQFPGWHFTTGEGAHDHPISHAATAVNLAVMFNRMRGTRILDLYGNPASNRAQNRQAGGRRRFDTQLSKCSGKDFVRAATKWGAIAGLNDFGGAETVWDTDLDDAIKGVNRADGVALNRVLGEYDGFSLAHTLYYTERPTLRDLLSLREGSVATALIHRFPDEQGTINNGEQRYVKYEVGGNKWVKQTNVRTGESYEHPDVEWVFTSGNTWADSQMSGTRGLAWTINLASTDSYIVTFTSIPAQVSATAVTPVRPDVDDKIRQIEMSGCVSVEIGDVTEIVDIKGVKTFEFMRNSVSGKQRTPEQFKDHLASTKRKLKAMNEKDDAAQVAVASFYVDINKDAALMARVVSASSSKKRTLATATKGVDPLGYGNVVDKLLLAGVFLVTHRASDPGKAFGQALEQIRLHHNANGI